jgi:hypothetical protein
MYELLFFVRFNFLKLFVRTSLFLIVKMYIGGEIASFESDRVQQKLEYFNKIIN